VALNKWILKNTAKDVSLRVVMEAIGVYHQKFAHLMILIQILFYLTKSAIICGLWI